MARPAVRACLVPATGRAAVPAAWAAMRATASAVGTTEATAEVFQDGGDGGAGVASGQVLEARSATLSPAPPPAAYWSFFNARSAAVPGRAVTAQPLSRRAWRANAVSDLTTTDTTSTVINVFVGAIGGEGGNDEEYYTDQQLYGFGLHGNPTGHGGNAEASANITGTDITTGFNGVSCPA